MGKTGRGELLDALFAELPDDPKRRLNRVVALQHAFRQKVVEALRPAVAELLRSSSESFIEIQTLATELNQAFHYLGIAVREPGSNRACSVIPNRGRPTGRGRIYLQTRKSPRRRSKASGTPGAIELIEAVREEGLARKTGRIGSWGKPDTRDSGRQGETQSEMTSRMRAARERLEDREG